MHTKDGDVPWVHAVDGSGHFIDTDLGTFQKMQAADPKVRVRNAQELAAGAAGVPQSQLGPVVTPTHYDAPGGAGTAPAASTPAAATPVAAPTAPPAPDVRGAAQKIPATPTPVGYEELSSAGKEQAHAENSMTGNKALIADRDAIYNEVAPAGRAAETLVLPIKNMASAAVGAMNGKGLSAPGSGSDWRVPFMKALETTARTAGVDPGDMTSVGTESDVLNKSRALLGGIIAHAGDQRSHAALESFMSMLPSMNMTKPAMAEITSQVVSANQRARDKASLMEKFKNENPMNATYENFNSVYNGAYTQGRYSQEQHQLQHLFMQNPSLAQKMLNNSLTPTEAQQALTTATKKDGTTYATGYDPRLVRYFY